MTYTSFDFILKKSLIFVCHTTLVLWSCMFTHSGQNQHRYQNISTKMCNLPFVYRVNVFQMIFDVFLLKTEAVDTHKCIKYPWTIQYNVGRCYCSCGEVHRVFVTLATISSLFDANDRSLYTPFVNGYVSRCTNALHGVLVKNSVSFPGLQLTIIRTDFSTCRNW